MNDKNSAFEGQQTIDLEKKEKLNKKRNSRFQMYEDINKILCEIEYGKFDTISIKLPTCLHNEIKEFLANNKILKKQDILAVALKDFLNKYDY